MEVVGVSGDSVRTQELFKKQHQLGFTLLADEDGTVAKQFGVPLKPGGELTVKVDGADMKVKRGVTPARWTFVIGKDGTIIYKNDKVKFSEDAKQVLAMVEKLGK